MHYLIRTFLLRLQNPARSGGLSGGWRFDLAVGGLSWWLAAILVLIALLIALPILVLYVHGLITIKITITLPLSCSYTNIAVFAVPFYSIMPSLHTTPFVRSLYAIKITIGPNQPPAHPSPSTLAILMYN